MNIISHKIKLLSVAAVLTLSLGLTTISQAVLAVNQNLTVTAKVSFTFDDGYTSAYTEAAPVLAKYGYSGTDYVVTGCVGMTTAPNGCRADSDLTYMDWTQVKALRDTYGWEIGSHTDTHPLLASTDPDEQPTKLTLEEVRSELTTSKNKLAEQGITAQSFATPYGDWDQTVLAEIAKVYTSHRGYADTGYNSFPYSDYLLRDQPVRVGVSVDTVKGYIDNAVANNRWLILSFHEIRKSPSSNPEDYQYSSDDLDAIAAYIQGLNIPVVNITDGLANSDVDLFNDQTFDSAISDTTTDTNTWSTDSPDLIKQDTADNGSTPSSSNSASMQSSTMETHLFSPIVAIDPMQSYVIKSYLNVTSITSGSVAFYIDEYDSLNTWISGQYKVEEPSQYLENLNFEYVPTSTTISNARLQIILAANSDITAYVDNIKFLSPVDPFKPGDANRDGQVDVYDLSVLASNWNKTSMTSSQGDFNGDGTVNVLDLSILASNWSN